MPFVVAAIVIIVDAGTASAIHMDADRMVLSKTCGALAVAPRIVRLPFVQWHSRICRVNLK